MAISLSDENPTDKHTQSVYIRSSSDMQRFLDRFFTTNLQNDITLVGEDVNVLFENFKNHFKYIEAAGGVVKNTDDEFLLIKRFDIWDLPKGKIEKKENPQDGAVREVMEETAVKNLDVEKKLPSTYHIYLHNEKYILKKTHWFLMGTKFEGSLVPQINEGITDAVWVIREKSLKALAGSYRSIKDILCPYLK